MSKETKVRLLYLEQRFDELNKLCEIHVLDYKWHEYAEQRTVVLDEILKIRREA